MCFYKASAQDTVRVLTNIIGVFRPGRSVAAALASKDASAKSAGQGRPATFCSPLLQTLTINTVCDVLIQLQTQAFTQAVSKCN